MIRSLFFTKVKLLFMNLMNFIMCYVLERLPNLIIISFQCDDNAIYYFRKKILKMDDENAIFMASIIFEARHTFQCPMDDHIFRICRLNNHLTFSAHTNDPSANRTVFNPPCKTLLSLLHQRCPSKKTLCLQPNQQNQK